MSKVYLAGGFHSGWQDEVIKGLADHPNVEFLDPRKTGLKSEWDYTRWDLDAIEDSDIVFACMEHDNPAGYDLMVEMGFAAALRKPIVFVETGVDSRSKYYGMARQISYGGYGGYRYLPTAIAALRILVRSMQT